MQKIQISIGERALVSIDQLVEFQGDLKTLSVENYHKLKRRILDLGYSFAVHAWKNPKDKKLYILDGHQRVRTMRMMQEEGYKIPQLPINLVDAKDIKQAKQKVLAGTSQFGEITGEGLYEYIAESGLRWQDVVTDYHFPEIDPVKFVESYYGEPIPSDATPPPRGQQVDGINTFLNNDMRYIQLVYPNEQYDLVIAALDKLSKKMKIADYSSLLAAMLGVSDADPKAK